MIELIIFRCFGQTGMRWQQIFIKYISHMDAVSEKETIISENT